MGILRPERKAQLQEFSRRDSLITALLLACLFFLGLYISLRGGTGFVLVYLALWIISYPVIYAGTCRHCAYYGKRCPVPLEGKLVHHFFRPSGRPFTVMALFWAVVSYALRIAVPVWVLIHQAMPVTAALYGGIFVLFWIMHLRVTGCTRCVNTGCPLNPDYDK